MTNSSILANRANSDQDKLLRPLAPLLNHTSQSLQMQLGLMLERGQRFGIKTFLRGNLYRQLSSIMLAGHLAGMKRADLMMQQSPLSEVQRPKVIEASLELSIFSGLLQYFRGRKDVDIKALQKQYDSTALAVLNSVADNINNDLQKTVQHLIETGSHVKEAKQVLGLKFEQYGIKPASKSQLETIFRTQTQIAYSAGKYNAERNDPFIYDHIWGYRYVTAGDDRVRPSHAILDGVTLPKGNPFWNRFYPPNGFNCRCQAIPLFEPHTIVKPPKRLPDGAIVRPDVGFSWSAGHIFNALGV